MQYHEFGVDQRHTFVNLGGFAEVVDERVLDLQAANADHGYDGHKAGDEQNRDGQSIGDARKYTGQREAEAIFFGVVHE